MEDQNKIGGKDPLGLEPGHFDKDITQAEDDFKAQYQRPGNADPGGMAIESPPPAQPGTDDDAVKLDTDGNPIVTKTDGEEVKFEFDTALQESELAELEELNAKLGTDFATLDDLKSSLKSSDRKDDLVKIQGEQDFINYFEAVLKYDDSKIVYEDERLKAQQSGKNLNDPDVVDEINAKIEQLEAQGVVGYAADTIRAKVETALKEKRKTVTDYYDKEKLTVDQAKIKAKENLQAGVNSVYKQGKFMGIQPTKEDMLSIYQDLSKEKHINHLRANPVDAVQFALFLKYKDTISKFFGKPSFNDGVTKVLKEIGLDPSKQPVAPVNTNDSEQEDLTYLEKFAL